MDNRLKSIAELISKNLPAIKKEVGKEEPSIVKNLERFIKETTK